MNSEKAIVLEGTIMMVLPGTMFRVALANQRMVLAHISGKMRKRFIRLTIGDRVKMEMSPYDAAKARIVYRLYLMTTRFLFDPPRTPKPKVGPTLKSLLVRCPSTSKLTDTGKTIEEERWATVKLKTFQLACLHCGTVHNWTKSDVILGRPTSRTR